MLWLGQLDLQSAPVTISLFTNFGRVGGLETNRVRKL